MKKKKKSSAFNKIRGTYLLTVINNYEGNIDPYIKRINSYKQLVEWICDKMLYPLVDLSEIKVTKKNYTKADEEEGFEIGYDFFSSYEYLWNSMISFNGDADEYFKLHRIHKGTILQEIAWWT